MVEQTKPVVYDRNMNRLGTLQRAMDIGFVHVFNDLWQASFSLPVRDAGNLLCQGVHTIVDIPDGRKSAGKYRISSEPESALRTEDAKHAYTLEHVLAFLLDDRLNGYVELGGSGVTTEMVIRRLLDFQSVRRWQLGTCAFSYQFQYAWENEDLLSALFSIPRCLDEPYHWVYDTDTYPFTIHLLRGEAEPACGLRFGRNERGIRRGRDLSTLCTRLYCLGSGEGVNQTGIRDAAGNSSHLPYIESANIDRYGVIARHLIDPAIQDPDVLYEKGKAYLHALEEPKVTYTIEALDLFRRTGLDWDRLEEGRVIRITDPGMDIDTAATIIEYRKTDVDGAPLEATVTLANRTEDVSAMLERIAQQSAIRVQYAQGATNLFPLQIMDNADESHPARLKFYVPESCRKINQVLLSYTLSPFRAYSTGAAAGGSESRTTASGGESTQTSSSGGASTETSSASGESTQTSSAASSTKGTTVKRTVVETIATSMPLQDGAAGDYTGGSVDALGAYLNETGAAAGQTGTMGEMNTGAARNGDGILVSTGEANGQTGSSGEMNTGAARNGDGVMTSTGSAGSHSHSVSTDSHHHYFSDSASLSIGHTHYVSGTGRQTGGMSTNYSKNVSISGNTGSSSPGGSTGSGGGHSHAVGHWHTLDGHRHSLGGHTHAMGHWHTLDAHSHSLGGHVHTMQHQHRFPHTHNVRVAVTIPALEVNLEGHTHKVTTPAHTHSVSIPAHTHTVSLPAHTHGFSIPDHRHGIVYGIYEGSMAGKVRIAVDGTAVPDSALYDSSGRLKQEIDVVPYMRMSGGRIVRGTWHEITLTPDRLTRIEANLFVQTFITSWSGGTY
ncbi:MAG: phage tail protein [Clostridia bacterium]|nr:phage tail protein [Clostridia bacterium]